MDRVLSMNFRASDGNSAYGVSKYGCVTPFKPNPYFAKRIDSELTLK